MKGAAQQIERDRRNFRRLEWHVLRPHAGKQFPTLEAYMGVPAAEPVKAQTGDQVYHVMRRWEAATKGLSGQARPRRYAARRKARGAACGGQQE